ncbi:MAG: thioredoxin family protein [Planctomycetota bacterium]
MQRTALTLSLLTALATAQDQDKDLWIQDFAAAKARAKAEKKDLLVDFTGSDWCGWCIKLDNEVFSKEAFRAEAPKHFVLVKLDYPRDKSILTEEIIKQNEALQATYAIQGFPTILLMTDEGRVYGQTGYQEGGPEPYNTLLADMKKKGAGFRAGLSVAMAKSGVERAVAIDDCLKELDPQVVDAYHFELMKEIVALDADGAAGLKAKYEEKVRQLEERRLTDAAGRELNELISDDMQNNRGKEALAKLDAVIAAPKSSIHKQMALFFKGMVTMDVSRDVDAAVALLEDAKKIAPESPVAGQIERILPQIKAQGGGGK